MALARPFLALIVALVLALSSQAMAVARGQAAVAGEIVLCSGGAAVTIAVDAEGRPTGAAHYCPDCVLHLLAGLPAAPAPLLRPEPAPRRAALAPQATGARPAEGRPPKARGPPLPA